MGRRQRTPSGKDELKQHKPTGATKRQLAVMTSTNLHHHTGSCLLVVRCTILLRPGQLPNEPKAFAANACTDQADRCDDMPLAGYP
jgi:hypothetical protein